MKVLAILGSPRKGGNTDILTERVLDAAREAGADIETIALRSLKISPCIGCERCWKVDGRPCAFKDDMPYQTIADADVLIFATPVYWYSTTAIMKAFLDRFVPFNRPEGKPRIQRKKAVLITAYEEEGPTAAEPLLRMMEMSFEYLHLECAGKLVVDGVGAKGAVLDRPEALSQAIEIGRRIAS